MANKFIAVALVVSLLFFSFSFLASAESSTDTIIEFHCGEPLSGGNNGYFILFYKTTNNEIYGRVIAWNVVKLFGETDSIYGENSMRVSVSQHNVNFQFTGYGSNDYQYYVAYTDITSNSNRLLHYSVSSSSPYSYTIDFAPSTYLGYYISNGFLESNYYGDESDYNYPVLWSEGTVLSNNLTQLINLCNVLHNDNNNLLSKLDDIFNKQIDIETMVVETYIVLNYCWTELQNLVAEQQQTNIYLLEMISIMQEIRDSLNSTGPPVDDLLPNEEDSQFGDYGDDLQNGVDSLPDLNESLNGSQYTSIARFFTYVFDSFFGIFIELYSILTIVLLLGFVGYVIGRKLNKE